MNFADRLKEKAQAQTQTESRETVTIKRRAIHEAMHTLIENDASVSKLCIAVPKMVLALAIIAEKIEQYLFSQED